MGVHEIGRTVREGGKEKNKGEQEGLGIDEMI